MKKRKIIGAVSLLLALIMVVCSAASCASLGEPVMELEGEELSINTFMLLLSRMKGTLASSFYYGEKARKDSFYDTIMSEGGKTYGQHFKEEVLASAKNYLAALYLFEEKGLELPDSYIEEIDRNMEELVRGDGEGSKTTLNSKLMAFGANYDVLYDAYLMEAKIEYLSDYLFGADGSKIAANLVEDYYEQNYVRFKHVFFYNYDAVYEVDENGDSVYYSINDGKKISYDTTAKIKRDADGVAVKDKNGDTVYVTEDGRIAYDKKNGKRAAVLGEDGKPKKEKYSPEKLGEISDKAQMVFEACQEKNYALFDSYVEKYSEDPGMDEFEGGYYVTRSSDYEEKVLDALFQMSEGEIRLIPDGENGIHVIMKYELEEGGYSKQSNSDFFVSKSDGSLIFLDELKKSLLSGYLSPYVLRITVDEALLASVDMKSVGVNFYY